MTDRKKNPNSLSRMASFHASKATENEVLEKVGNSVNTTNKPVEVAGEIKNVQAEKKGEQVENKQESDLKTSSSDEKVKKTFSISITTLDLLEEIKFKMKKGGKSYYFGEVLDEAVIDFAKKHGIIDPDTIR